MEKTHTTKRDQTMEDHSSSSESETLGALFRKLRMERSLDISDVSEETRIPIKTLRAMEADDYEVLPAHVFARGFYSLYAKMLDLDQQEILQRFSSEHANSGAVEDSDSVTVPSWQGKNIGTMAERPSITPGSIIGLSLLLIILAGAGISWWAGFNPATYVSKWLRGLQESPAQVEQQVIPPSPQPLKNKTEATAPQPEQPAQASAPVPENIKYQLVAEFHQPTRITIAIDEDTTKSFLLPAGTIETWQAQKNIVLELPADTTTKLYLNGIVIPMPPATDDKIIVSIPEYLLD